MKNKFLNYYHKTLKKLDKKIKLLHKKKVLKIIFKLIGYFEDLNK